MGEPLKVTSEMEYEDVAGAGLVITQAMRMAALNAICAFDDSSQTLFELTQDVYVAMVLASRQ